MKILAALSSGAERPLELVEAELDPPRDEEILVRLAAVGVCHTDLSLRQVWPTAIVLGHEGAGVVEAVGPAVRGVDVGDHVVLTFSSCGDCSRCRSGHPSYCDSFAMLNASGARPDGSSPLSVDGTPVSGCFFGQSSFASHALTVARNTVVVPRTLDLTLAAPLGCSVQTGAGAVHHVLRPDRGQSLVVYGAGGVGLAAVMAAAAEGIERIVVVDRLAARLTVAESLGATAVILAGADGLVDDVRAATGGGADRALDTTGVPAVVTQAALALAQEGVLALVGLGATTAEFDVTDLIGGGKVVRGVIEGDADPQRYLPRLAEMLATGRLPLEQIIRTYPFADIATAFADTASGDVIKPVLTF